MNWEQSNGRRGERERKTEKKNKLFSATHQRLKSICINSWEWVCNGLTRSSYSRGSTISMWFPFLPRFQELVEFESKFRNHLYRMLSLKQFHQMDSKRLVPFFCGEDQTLETLGTRNFDPSQTLCSIINLKQRRHCNSANEEKPTLWPFHCPLHRSLIYFITRDIKVNDQKITWPLHYAVAICLCPKTIMAQRTGAWKGGKNRGSLKLNKGSIRHLWNPIDTKLQSAHFSPRNDLRRRQFN